MGACLRLYLARTVVFRANEAKNKTVKSKASAGEANASSLYRVLVINLDH